MTIIKKQDTYDEVCKIIPIEELQQLLNAKASIKKAKEKYKKIINQANIDAKYIKEKAKEDILSEVSLQSEKINKELEERINKFLNIFSQEAYQIIYKILLKLGFEQISAIQIKTLIENEINEKKPNQSLTITANSNTISELKNLYSLENNITFKIDETLIGGTCICDTGLYLLHVNITDAMEQIKSFLNQ